jgi:ribosome-associated protein
VIVINDQLTIPDDEVSFTTSRSGGPGGQHVNKVETRVTLWFDVAGSPTLSDAQRARLLRALATRINKEGVMRLVVATARSQRANRDTAVERFCELLAAALRPRKKRRPTRPTRAAVERRLEEKRQRSQQKRRRRPDYDRD